MFGMNGHTGQSHPTKSCFWPLRIGFMDESVGDSDSMSNGVSDKISVVGLDLPAGFVHPSTGGRWRQR